MSVMYVSTFKFNADEQTAVIFGTDGVEGKMQFVPAG